MQRDVKDTRRAATRGGSGVAYGTGCPRCGKERVDWGYAMRLCSSERTTRTWARCRACSYVWQWRGVEVDGKESAS